MITFCSHRRAGALWARVRLCYGVRDALSFKNWANKISTTAARFTRASEAYTDGSTPSTCFIGQLLPCPRCLRVSAPGRGVLLRSELLQLDKPHSHLSTASCPSRPPRGRQELRASPPEKIVVVSSK